MSLGRLWAGGLAGCGRVLVDVDLCAHLPEHEAQKGTLSVCTRWHRAQPSPMLGIAPLFVRTSEACNRWRDGRAVAVAVAVAGCVFATRYEQLRRAKADIAELHRQHAAMAEAGERQLRLEKELQGLAEKKRKRHSHLQRCKADAANSQKSQGGASPAVIEATELCVACR